MIIPFMIIMRCGAAFMIVVATTVRRLSTVRRLCDDCATTPTTGAWCPRDTLPPSSAPRPLSIPITPLRCSQNSASLRLLPTLRCVPGMESGRCASGGRYQEIWAKYSLSLHPASPPPLTNSWPRRSAGDGRAAGSLSRHWPTKSMACSEKKADGREGESELR